MAAHRPPVGAEVGPPAGPRTPEQAAGNQAGSWRAAGAEAAVQAPSQILMVPRHSALDPALPGLRVAAAAVMTSAPQVDRCGSQTVRQSRRHDTEVPALNGSFITCRS